MHFDRVDLIGHSLAGTEMTVFATRYPARVRHLVYLDAAYDLASGREVAVKAHMPLGSGTSPVQQLNDGAGRTHLDFTALHVPALAFFVLYDRPEDPPGIRPESRLRPELIPYLREQVAIFRRDMKRGEAVELRNTDHTFFNDPRIQASVVDRVQTFLRR
jgi:pimeloyl-ACP methyl ester carboxylesterase